VPVTIKPVKSDAPRGTTISVDLHATRNHQKLRVDVTAAQDGVIVQADLDGHSMPARLFHAPRKREADLLAETIDAAGRDHISGEVIAMAAELVAT
jgi:thymidine phosphorylase